MKIIFQIILLFYFYKSIGQDILINQVASAKSLINDNRFTEAIQVLENCQTNQCLQEIGYCYAKLGNLKKSNTYYLQASEINPKNHSALFALSQNFERMGNFSKAKEYYQKLLNYDSTNVVYNKLFAGLMVKLGQDSIAILYYKTVCYLNGSDLESINELSKLYFKANSFFNCKTLIDRGLKLDSLYIPLLQLKTKLAYKENNLKEVVSLVGQIMTIGDSTLFYQRLLGFSYFRMDSTQKTIETLEKYVLRGEPNEIVHYYLGLCYLKISNSQKAKENLDKAIIVGVSENVTDYFYMLGYLEETDKKYEKAIEYYEKAYTFGQRPDLVFMLARSYDWLNNKDKAIELYKKYLKLSSKTFLEDTKKRLSQMNAKKLK
jgi:tetratricopeptide (TPR) repeat protein